MAVRETRGDTMNSETGGERQLLTIPRVAEILQCSERHIWRLVKRGELRSVLVGRLRRIPLNALPSA